MAVVIKIKNNDSVAHTWVGQTIQPANYYTLQQYEQPTWANDATLLTAVANSIAVVNDGSQDLTDINVGINWLKGSALQLANGSGTVTALSGAVIASISVYSVVVFKITGTWVGTLTLQASLDGVNWDSIQAYAPSSGNWTNATTTNMMAVVPCGGYVQVQWVATAWTSGTANITYNASLANNVTQVFSTSAAAFNATVQPGNTANSTPWLVNQPNTSGSGSVSALNGTVVATIGNNSIIGISISGTWTGTLSFQGSVDGSTFGSISGYVPASGNWTNATGSNFIATFPCGGFVKVQVIATAWTSGTANITYNSSLGNNVTEVFSTSAAAFSAQVRNQDNSGTGITSTVSGSHTGFDVVLNAPTKTTYSVGTGTFTPPATPTDMIVMQGSATKTIKILSIVLYTTQTTAGSNQFYLKRYSTLDTGGTSATVTALPFDTNNAAATAVFKKYTANPTLGTLTGIIDIAYISTGGVGAPLLPFDWDFANNLGQPLTLRGATDQISINFNGAALPSGLLVAASIMFTEE